MGETERTYVSYAGLVDYKFFYPAPIVYWTVIGTVLLIATMVSYCPQPIKIIKAKSSFGLAAFSVFSQAACLWLMCFNVLCLKFSDFVGLFQHLDFYTYARLLTFLNVFAQWMMYSPVPYLIMIMHDKRVIPGRDKIAVRKDWKLFRSIPIAAGALYFSCVLLWVILGLVFGFDSNAIKIVGKASGIAGFVIEMVQFLPQVYTTIKMKSSGSLSVLMLEIQAPVNLLNAFFMWFGNGESWTTFSASMADGGWEFVLLGLCLFYSYRGKKKTEDDTGLQLHDFNDNKNHPRDIESFDETEKEPASQEFDEDGNPIAPSL